MSHLLDIKKAFLKLEDLEAGHQRVKDPNHAGKEDHQRYFDITKTEDGLKITLNSRYRERTVNLAPHAFDAIQIALEAEGFTPSLTYNHYYGDQCVQSVRFGETALGNGEPYPQKLLEYGETLTLTVPDTAESVQKLTAAYRAHVAAHKDTHVLEMKDILLEMEDVVIGHHSKTHARDEAFRVEQADLPSWKREEQATQIMHRKERLANYVTAKKADGVVTLTLNPMGQPLIPNGNGALEPLAPMQDLIAELANVLTSAGIKDVKVTNQYQCQRGYKDIDERNYPHAENPNYGDEAWQRVSEHKPFTHVMPGIDETISARRELTEAEKKSSDAETNFPKLEVTLPDDEYSVSLMKKALTNLVKERGQVPVNAGLAQAQLLTDRLKQFGIPR